MLEPRTLELSQQATALWIEFHDLIESQIGEDLEPIKDFAAKAAEQAARIAGVMTIVEDFTATVIGEKAMGNALMLTDWYVGEALRLHQAGMTDPRLRRASALLEWLQRQPKGKATFREILQFRPNQTRDKATADEALAIIKSHNWIVAETKRPRTVQVAMP